MLVHTLESKKVAISFLEIITEFEKNYFKCSKSDASFM